MPIVREQHLQKRLPSPTGRLNLGFLLRENLLPCSSYLPLGVPNGSLLREHQATFSGAIAGEKKHFCKGSLSLPIFLLCYCFAYFIFVCFVISKTHKKLVVAFIRLPCFYFIMTPKYALKDLLVGSGSIIGRDNIEEFFNHVSKHEDIEDRSLAELAPNYETAAAQLVQMLEARFVSLNPVMQQMFLKLHEVENDEKRDFILATLLKEFKDVVIEARKVFDRFQLLGSCVDVIGTLDKTKPEIKVPIPFKLVGMHEALENNFDWIVPENPINERSEPKNAERGTSKTYIDKIQIFIEKTSGIDLNASSLENT